MESSFLLKIALATFFWVQVVQGEIVTLTGTNTYTVPDGYFAKLLWQSWGENGDQSTRTLFVKGNVTYVAASTGLGPIRWEVNGAIAAGAIQPVIAGPALVKMNSTNAIATLEVLPQALALTSAIVPQGTSAAVAFESSVDLVNWTAVSSTNIVNATTNSFFRLRLQRN
jgi:hypothetical protein